MTNGKEEFDIEGMAAEEEKRKGAPVARPQAKPATTAVAVPPKAVAVAAAPKIAGLRIFGTIDTMKQVLNAEYMKMTVSMLGDEAKAKRFMSNIVASVQRTPKLLECEPTSLVNSFMTVASLGFMPSGVNGQAYVLPFMDKGVQKAQFILGYKGMVALAFRSPIVKDIACELVYEKDEFETVNGDIHHKFDAFSSNRGKVRGAYCIVRLTTGGKVQKAMSIEDITEIAEKYSKSYGQAFSPWKNDPDGWMFKKTVLRQTMKLVPMDDRYAEAIAREDAGDSTIATPDRTAAAKGGIASLKMGAFAKSPDAFTDAEIIQGESLEEGVQA
jgi:recombination protein RecT